MMRITAGMAKGRGIEVPPKGTRPTSALVREAMFNLLQGLVDLEGASVLDLFSGSGALGLEAASRGATRVLLVESAKAAARVAGANARRLGFAGVRVLQAPAERVVARTQVEAPFDLVLADPPYGMDPKDLDVVLATLARGENLAGRAVIVLEQAKGQAQPTWPSTWTALGSRRYGDTILRLTRVAG